MVGCPQVPVGGGPVRARVGVVGLRGHGAAGAGAAATRHLHGAGARRAGAPAQRRGHAPRRHDAPQVSAIESHLHT